MKSRYDPEHDILSIRVSEGTYWKSVELGDLAVIDISRDGNVIGLEIFKASHFFRDEASKILQQSTGE